ncbi:MAG: N-acetyltransferase protein [Patescibacteria group bacterium]|nr:N-acetyltransferase protein [Patescibacteria group bacterium]
MERSLTHHETPSPRPEETPEQKAALSALFDAYKIQQEKLLARGYKNPFHDNAFNQTLYHPSSRASWKMVGSIETPDDAVAILNIIREGDARRRSSSEAERHAWRDFAHSMTRALNVFDTASHLPAKDVLSLYGTFLQTDLAPLIDDSTLQTLNEAIIERHGEFLEAFSSANPVEKVLFSHVVHEMRSRTSQYASSADRFWTNSFFSSLFDKAKESSFLSYLIVKQSASEHAPEQEDSRFLPIWTHFIDKTSSRSHDDAKIIAKNALGEISEQGVVTAVATIPLNKDLSKTREVPSSAIFTTILSRLKELDPEEDWEDLREWCLGSVQPFLSADERERLNRAWDDLSRDIRPLQQELLGLQRHFGYTPVHFSPVDEVAVHNRTPLKEHERIALQNLHRPAIKAPLEQALGIPLQDLSLREQASFLGFLIKTDKQTFDQTAEIIHTHGIHAAQTFLACEQGAKHGEQILAFAQTAPKDVADRVFAKFAEIADLVDTSSQDLASQFLRSSENDTAIDAEDVRRELIKRGARILTEAHTLIQKDPSGKELLERLERYKADTVLFLSLCTTTLKQHHGQLQLEQLRDIEVSTQSMNELSAGDKREMAQLLEQQWSKKPLEHLFPSEGWYSFFLLRRKGRIIGFLRFEALPNRAYHANFLCVDESLRGSGLGEQLFTEVMDRAAKTGPVHAEFDPAIPAGSMYIERFGFIGTGTVQEERPGGAVEWITLERNTVLSRRLASRDASATPDQLRVWAEEGNAPKPLRIALFKGDAANMEAQMLAALHEAKRNDARFLLSRYLRRALPNGQEERLLVFDIPQENPRPRGKRRSRITHLQDAYAI